jgi:uracil-DNA glycosylase
MTRSTLDGPARQALRARLEWLRLLGIEEVPVRTGGPQPAQGGATTRTPARPAPPSAGIVQAGLFGGEEVLDGAALPGGKLARGRRAGVGEEPPSPLAAARAPDAPDAATALRLIREEIGDCRRCRLCEQRTKIVFGVGSAQSRLMFVGEGPGADEDATGRPFVGRAGQLLDKMIAAIRLKREQVYIANIVKCRPPENRTPEPDEVRACAPYLERQIATLRPRLICTLGLPATRALLPEVKAISAVRGREFRLGAIPLVPTFHPAYLLRNPAAKPQAWEDLKTVARLIGMPVDGR